MKTETIDIICAWCDSHMGTKEVPYNPQMVGMATHTICEDCLAVWTAQVIKETKEANQC